MKRFFRKHKKDEHVGHSAEVKIQPPAAPPIPPPQQTSPSASDFTGGVAPNLHANNEIPAYPSKSNVETTTRINPDGRRVTTTTVKLSPPPDAAINGGGELNPFPVSNAHASSFPSSAIAAAPPVHIAPFEKPPPPDNTESTRNLVKKFIADIWNRGEIDLIPEVCSSSLRFNGNNGFDRVGHEGLARMVATIREALAEYHCEIHSMVVEDKKAFCRLRFTGKHVGELLGYPPTNKVVGWMGATEFTCQNGKILKVWELGDVKSLEEQLSASEV